MTLALYSKDLSTHSPLYIVSRLENLLGVLTTLQLLWCNIQPVGMVGRCRVVFSQRRPFVTNKQKQLALNCLRWHMLLGVVKIYYNRYLILEINSWFRQFRKLYKENEADSMQLCTKVCMFLIKMGENEHLRLHWKCELITSHNFQKEFGGQYTVECGRCWNMLNFRHKGTKGRCGPLEWLHKSSGDLVLFFRWQAQSKLHSKSKLPFSTQPQTLHFMNESITQKSGAKPSHLCHMFILSPTQIRPTLCNTLFK